MQEHLRLTVIPERSHVLYATSLLCVNVALWWGERCESGHRPKTWEHFCIEMRAQFHLENYSRRGRDELAVLHQYKNESIADFVFHFRAICLKIEDLVAAEKLDCFCACAGS